MTLIEQTQTDQITLTEAVPDRLAAVVLRGPSEPLANENRGLTTTVVHEPKSWFGAQIQQRVAQGTRRRTVRLRPLLETGVANAFAIDIGPTPPRKRNGGLPPAERAG